MTTHRAPRTPVRRSRMAGLSLIELMVALLISTILTLGLVEVFAASRAAYQMSEGLARVQENGRFAMDYLQRDLRMIGHFGCVNDQSHKQQVGAFGLHTGAAAGSPLDFNLSVEGFEANGTAPGATLNPVAPAAGWTPNLPGHIAALNPRPGSDIVMLRFLRGTGAPVTNVAVAGGNTTISFDAGNWDNLTNDGVAAPSLLGVGDCSFVDVFPGAANAGGTATAGVAIDRYTPHPSGQAVLYRAEAVAYYVGTGASGRPALFRARWGGNGALIGAPEELVEGIESLQFLYGQDQSADVTNPSGFIGNQDTAQALGVGTTPAGEEAWRRVGLVQVGVVAASVERASAQQAAEGSRPMALGVTIAAGNDGNLRTTYESTVALRNRLYGN